MPTFTKPNIQFDDSANYRCIAINSIGRDTSRIAKVVVRPVPEYSTIVTTSADNGTGSLREIVEVVNDGDTVFFAS